jgi:hypothetical protein
LWFVEKDLFRQGGSNSKVNADYLDAAYRLVRKVKSGELPGLEQANQPFSGGVLKMDKGGLVPPRAQPVDDVPVARAQPVTSQPRHQILRNSVLWQTSEVLSSRSSTAILI